MTEKTGIEIESVRYYRYPKYSSLISLQRGRNMYSFTRALTLILGIFVIPSVLLVIPLYLRNKTFADISFAVTETDVLEITEGISTLFCQAQTLRMNSSFNAFQIDGHAAVDLNYKKHFRLRKSMLVLDDTIEYWGFFLNKGSAVNLSLCSRYPGGRIMVVKDIKNVDMCGLLETKQKILQPHTNKVGTDVQVTIETNAEVINNKNSNEYEGENMSEERFKTETVTTEKIEQKKFLLNHTDETLLRDKRVNNVENINDEITISESTKRNNYSNSRFIRSANERPITHVEGFLHGKTNNETDDSSVSSFENMLLTCHDGRILLNNNFTTSQFCTSSKYLENGTHMQVQHNVHEDGYYFYIFYSDNDDVANEIHAIFDIFKPTYEHGDYVRGCVNRTECTFPITMFSSEKVIVEIPVRHGIEYEVEDVTILGSTCQPRTLVYVIFPTMVIVLIFVFSFV